MLKITEGTETNEPKMKYPKLVKGKGSNRLAIAYSHNYIRYLEYGKIADDSMRYFTDYNQPITISNQGE